MGPEPSRADKIMDKLAALHEPDMVAGGWHDPKPSGLGNRSVNSAIGGSWNKKGRVPMLEDAAKMLLHVVMVPT